MSAAAAGLMLGSCAPAINPPLKDRGTGSTITVWRENATPDFSSARWYLDGQFVGYVSGETFSAEVKPGPHRVKVVYPFSYTTVAESAIFTTREGKTVNLEVRRAPDKKTTMGSVEIIGPKRVAKLSAEAKKRRALWKE